MYVMYGVSRVNIFTRFMLIQLMLIQLVRANFLMHLKSSSNGVYAKWITLP